MPQQIDTTALILQYNTDPEYRARIQASFAKQGKKLPDRISFADLRAKQAGPPSPTADLTPLSVAKPPVTPDTLRTMQAPAAADSQADAGLSILADTMKTALDKDPSGTLLGDIIRGTVKGVKDVSKKNIAEPISRFIGATKTAAKETQTPPEEAGRIQANVEALLQGAIGIGGNRKYAGKDAKDRYMANEMPSEDWLQMTPIEKIEEYAKSVGKKPKDLSQQEFYTALKIQPTAANGIEPADNPRPEQPLSSDKYPYSTTLSHLGGFTASFIPIAKGTSALLAAARMAPKGITTSAIKLAFDFGSQSIAQSGARYAVDIPQTLKGEAIGAAESAAQGLALGLSGGIAGKIGQKYVMGRLAKLNLPETSPVYEIAKKRLMKQAAAFNLGVESGVFVGIGEAFAEIYGVPTTKREKIISAAIPLIFRVPKLVAMAQEYVDNAKFEKRYGMSKEYVQRMVSDILSKEPRIASLAKKEVVKSTAGESTPEIDNINKRLKSVEGVDPTQGKVSKKSATNVHFKKNDQGVYISKWSDGTDATMTVEKAQKFAGKFDAKYKKYVHEVEPVEGTESYRITRRLRKAAGKPIVDVTPVEVKETPKTAPTPETPDESLDKIVYTKDFIESLRNSPDTEIKNFGNGVVGSRNTKIGKTDWTIMKEDAEEGVEVTLPDGTKIANGSEWREKGAEVVPVKGAEDFQSAVDALKALGNEAHIDDIAKNMGIEPTDALAKLLIGELKGAVTQLPGKKFKIAEENIETPAPPAPSPTPPTGESPATRSDIMMVDPDTLIPLPGFQGRKTAIAEHTAESITSAFDPNRWHEPWVLINPETKEVHPIAHTRPELARRFKASGTLTKIPGATADKIPVRVFDAKAYAASTNPPLPEPKNFDDEIALARRFARVESNRTGQQETEWESWTTFNEFLRDESEENLIQTFKNTQLVRQFRAYSNLDPHGMFMAGIELSLKSNSGMKVEDAVPSDIRRVARYMGELRGTDLFKEKLSNNQEQEVYAFLYDTSGKLRSKLNQETFKGILSGRVADPAYQKGMPLNLEADAFNSSEKSKLPAHIRERLEKNESQQEMIKDLRATGAMDDNSYNVTLQNLKREQRTLLEEYEKANANQAKLFPTDKPPDELNLGVNFMFMPDPRDVAKVVRNAAVWAKRRLVAAKRVRENKGIGSTHDLGLLSYIGSSSNLVGAIPGQTPVYGEPMAKAVRNLLLASRDISVDIGRRSDIFDRQLKDIGKIGPDFTDEMIAKAREDVKYRDTVGPGIRTVIEDMNSQHREDWYEIVSYRRYVVKKTIAPRIAREYRQERGYPLNQKLTPEEKEEVADLIDETVEEMVPMDGGIRDHFHHTWPGDFMVKRVLKVDGEEEPALEVVGSAATRFDAQLKALEHLEKHGGSADDYVIEGKSFAIPDVVRISSGKMYHVLNELNESLGGQIPKDELRDFLRPAIGTKAGKTKRPSFLKKREGAPAYSTDQRIAEAVYIMSFVRWKHLRDIRRQVQPAIDATRQRGHEMAARYLEHTLEYVWGRAPSNSELAFDNFLQKTPLGPFVEPQALARWTIFARNLATMGFLQFNPRFHALNSFQTLQTLWPIASAGEIVDGWKFMHSKEGKKVMREYGVQYLASGKALESQPLTRHGVRRKLAEHLPEAFNQNLTWATMFLIGKKAGLSNQRANDYAYLRGNVMSQFIPNTADSPKVARNPVGALFFLWKRFGIKNLELFAHLMKSRQYRGATKWAVAQMIMAGAVWPTRIATSIGGLAGIGTALWIKELYDDTRDKYGERVADTLLWGMPGFFGVDLSYSFILMDLPYGNSLAEKVGNLAIGPIGTTVSYIAQAGADTKGVDPSAISRMGRASRQRIPVFKFMDAWEALQNKVDEGKYDFKAPDGMSKYKLELGAVYAKMAGFRTTSEAREQLIIEAFSEVQKERDGILDRVVMELIANPDKARMMQFTTPSGTPKAVPVVDFSEIEQWNKFHGEYGYISLADVLTRYLSRKRSAGMTQSERVLKQGSNKTARTFQEDLKEE